MGQFKTQKPILYSTQKKDRACRRFYRVVFSLILVFGLFLGFLLKTTSASNDYVDNFIFTMDMDDTYLGLHPIKLSFHVKTTFDITWWQDANGCWSCYGFSPDQIYFANGNYSYYPDNPEYNRTILYPVNSNSITSIACPNTTITYTAGNTYSFWLSAYYQLDPLYWAILYNPDYPATFGVFTNPCNQTLRDTEKYPFTEYPTLTITFPHANDEMVGTFYIDGTYSTPLTKFNILYFNAQIVGYSGAYNLDLIELTSPTGTIHERVGAGFPANNYILSFQFSGAGGIYDVPFTIPIKILVDIPPELPTGETPPIIPAFGYTSPQTYYDLHSNYSTSTALFNDLTASVGALLSKIGNSLSAFAGKFTLSDAQNTGTIFGNSILLLRSYADNLNSFFGNLPISQFLVFYLIIFVAVVIFRLIKNLINLIKI